MRILQYVSLAWLGGRSWLIRSKAMLTIVLHNHLKGVFWWIFKWKLTKIGNPQPLKNSTSLIFGLYGTMLVAENGWHMNITCQRLLSAECKMGIFWYHPVNPPIYSMEKMWCLLKSSDVIRICHENVRNLTRNVRANLLQVLQVGKMISQNM